MRGGEIARELRKRKKGRSRFAVEFSMEWRSQQHRKHNVVAPWSTKTLSSVMERICSVGMNPRAAADWSARLVTVSVVKTLLIDLSEVAYIAIEPPSPPGGSETGFLHSYIGV